MNLKFVHYSCVVATILILSVQAFSQQSTSSPRPEEPTSGSITGRVVAETGQALPGATIFIRGVGSVGFGRSATSDQEGNFRFNKLEPALYQVSANSAAYTFEVFNPDKPPVYYRIGDNIRLELIRGGVITGTVTNSAGDPVISARVRALLIRDEKGETNRSLPGGESLTDDRGIYRLYGLRPGTYLLYAGGTSFQSIQSGPYDLDAPTYAPSATRDNAAEIVVRAGEESNVDVRYRGEAGRSVSGTVKNVGTQGTVINLSVAGTGLVPAFTAFINQTNHGFAFFGVPDGEYEIVAQQTNATGGQPAEALFSEVRRITVKGIDVSGIELTPQPLALIAGSIVLQPSTIPECQNKRRPAFRETLIDVVRNSKGERDDQSYLRAWVSASQPDKNGAFTIRNLRDGQYSFNTKFFARYWYLHSISMSGPAKPATPGKTVTASTKTDAGRSWVPLKSGDRLNGLTVTLAEGAASIRGQVSVDGQKLPDNLQIFVVPAEREKADDPFRYFVSSTSGDGTFAFNNLPPGKYFLLAQPNNDAELAPEKIRFPNAAESRSKLRRTAEAAKVELELKPCQNLIDYKLTKIQ